ncbi:MAG: hypothetical protein ACFFDP_02370 [Promethearchaeota archaeon]
MEMLAELILKIGGLKLDNLLSFGYFANGTYVFTMPFIIIFILIILLMVCIIYAAIQGASSSSRPSAYARASPKDDWTPIELASEQRQWVSSKHQVTVIVCTCGKWNDPRQPVCWSCNASLKSSEKSLQTFKFETAPQCAVCGYWVYPGEQVMLCPACQAQGHSTHMLEYIKAKGACPVCEQRIRYTQLLQAKSFIT